MVKNARMQVVYDNAARWVTAQYLSTTKPATPAYPVEKGLKPNAIKVHRAVRATFPQITSIGGVRRDPIPDHPSGRALDLMIPELQVRLRQGARPEGRPVGEGQRQDPRRRVRDLEPAHLEHQAGQGGLALHGQPRRRLRQPQEPRAHHRVRLTFAEPPDVGVGSPPGTDPTNIFRCPSRPPAPQRSALGREASRCSVGSTCGVAFIRWRTSARVA